MLPLWLNFTEEDKHILKNMGVDLNARKLYFKFIRRIHYKIQDMLYSDITMTEHGFYKSV
jgi:hypothetical protein